MTDVEIKIIVTVPAADEAVPDRVAENIQRILRESRYSSALIAEVFDPEPSPTAKLNAAKLSDYNQLTDEQKNLVTSVRWLLSDRDNPAADAYRLALTEMLALQLFADVAETDRVSRLINPWPVVDDVTLATLGHLVVEALRNNPPNNQFTLGRAVQSAARDLGIVFTI